MAEQQFEETLDEQVQLMTFIANYLKKTPHHVLMAQIFQCNSIAP